MFSWRRFAIFQAATVALVFLEPVPWALFVVPRIDLYAAILVLWISGFCILWAGSWLALVAAFRGWSS